METNQQTVQGMFTEEARFQSYLEVEAALARAQAKLGVIPSSAAAVISEKANLNLLKLGNIHDENGWF